LVLYAYSNNSSLLLYAKMGNNRSPRMPLHRHNAILRVQGWCTTMVYKLQKNTYNTAQAVDIASVL